MARESLAPHAYLRPAVLVPDLLNPTFPHPTPNTHTGPRGSTSLTRCRPNPPPPSSPSCQRQKTVVIGPRPLPLSVSKSAPLPHPRGWGAGRALATPPATLTWARGGRGRPRYRAVHPKKTRMTKREILMRGLRRAGAAMGMIVRRWRRARMAVMRTCPREDT